MKENINTTEDLLADLENKIKAYTDYLSDPQTNQEKALPAKSKLLDLIVQHTILSNQQAILTHLSEPKSKVLLPI